MKNLIKSDSKSFAAAGIVLFSIILMITTIPFVLSNTSENINSESSSIAISVAIIIHIFIMGVYFKLFRENRHNKYRDGGYVAIAILFIIFGLIYMDGAITFVNSKETRLISVLMFGSVFCDLTASVLMIIIYISKPKRKLRHT